MAQKTKQTTPIPTPAGLYPRWQAALARLEERALALVTDLADALERGGEKNPLDLIATTNALLDLLDRLHQRAYVIQRHTYWSHLPPGERPVKPPLEVPDDLLLGTNGSTQ